MFTSGDSLGGVGLLPENKIPAFMGNLPIQTVICGVPRLVSYFFAPPLSGKAERYNDIDYFVRLGCASLVVGSEVVLKSVDSAKRC